MSFPLGTGTFTGLKPPSHPRAWRHGVQAGLFRLKAAPKNPPQASASRYFGVYFKNYDGMKCRRSFLWFNMPLSSLLCQLTRKWHHSTFWVRRGRAQNSSQVQVQTPPSCQGQFLCHAWWFLQLAAWTQIFVVPLTPTYEVLYVFLKNYWSILNCVQQEKQQILPTCREER